MVRPGVIVSTVVSIFLILIGAALLILPTSRGPFGPLPDHGVSNRLHVELDAQDRFVDRLRKFASANGFDFDLRSSPLGPQYLSIGMIQKDKNHTIVIMAYPPFDDPTDIRLSVIQDDTNPETPARVDAINAALIEALRGMLGVRFKTDRT